MKGSCAQSGFDKYSSYSEGVCNNKYHTLCIYPIVRFLIRFYQHSGLL